MYDEIKSESKLEISKVFDISIKNEKEIKSVYIDENKYLKNLFFLSNDKKIYFLNILTKELEEFNFSRGHQVIYITGNINNTYLIMIFKNCKIYAMDLSNKSILYFKNLQSVPMNLNEEGKENIFSPKLKFFASENLNKAILYTGEEIIIWFRHQLKYNIKKNIRELIGYHIYIQLQEEKKSFIKEKQKYIDNLICFFNNDIFQGSAINIYYFMVFKIPKTNLFKLVIINYTFFFNKENMFNCSDTTELKEKYYINNEIKKKFSTKYSFTYLMKIDDVGFINYKEILQKIIVKQNRNGIMILIGINFSNDSNNIIILFLTESYRFFSSKISKLFPVKKFKMTIEDLAFINNDYFILIYFVDGYFVLLNTNFQIVKFYDHTNSFSNFEKTNNIYIFNTFLSINLCKDNYSKNAEKTNFHIITNVNRIISYEDENLLINNPKEKYTKYYDYIIIYTDSKIIGFHVNNKGISYIDGLLRSEVKDFDDIIYLIQFLQLNDFDDNKKGFLFDKVHNYLVLNFGQIFQSLKAVINPLITENDLEQNLLNNESGNSDLNNNVLKSIFIKFLNIYRYLNITNYSPLSLVSYFIVLTSDFFLFLISQKDVWLSFLLVELGEKYLLHKLKLRNYKNNINDAKYLQGKISFMIFNPNFLQASSVKGYNRINNYSLFSKLRLLIIFFCLMEFRNNQARNINVLYFVLAKLVVDKLKKENLLDDLNFMIKVVIRNWKYLKSENMKSGEEYILNSFSMNQKADTLALLLHTNNFITSNYIGRKMVTRSMGNGDNVTAIRNTKSRFDFFNDFYSLDELTNFNNFIINYSSGQDNILSREFNYFNHLGIVQKWMTYFINFLYPELFKDYKQYINTHLKQTISNNIKKKPENTSQDEKNLNKMIFFNLYIFMNILIQFNKDIFNYIINYNPNKKNTFFNMVLPPDMPYLTSEFYAMIYNIIEKNSNHKNIFLNQINDIYCQLWERYKKEIEYDINNAFDFCHFLMMKGFKYYLNDSQILSNYIESNNNDNKEENTMMYYIFSLLEFSIIVIHKNNLFCEIETKKENCFIFNVINILPDKFKKNIYELCFVVFTGHIRDYIYKQIGGGKNENLKPQEEYNFYVCVNFLKTLFISYISEENPIVFENVNEFFQILPDFMKLQFLDEGLEHLFFIFSKNFSKNILDTKNILNEKNFIYFNKNNNDGPFIKDLKISEALYNTIFFDKKNKYNNFNIILSNMINLIFNGSKHFEFELEVDSNKILNIMKNNVNEKFFDEIIYGKIDELKTIYKDSSYIDKILTKIKITIIKIFHLLSILFLKFKLLKLNLKTNQLEMLQFYVLLVLLVENEKNYSFKIDSIYKSLKYIINNNDSESFHKGIVEILININLGFIYRQLEQNNSFKELEKFIGEKHKNLMDLYSYTISNNINIFSKLQGKYKDEQNKFTLFFSIQNYVKLLNEIYMMTSSESVYQQNQNKEKNKNKEIFKEQREIYKILLEKYYNLTGFNVNMIIEFEEDWDLSINNPIYNLIISDKFSGRKFYNKDLFESIISDKIKQEPIELPLLFTPKEEDPNKKIKEEENKVEENEEEIKLYKLEFKNKKRKDGKNFVKSRIDKYNKYEIFSLLIKKIILNKFQNQLFMCFKKRNEILNLEKIELIKIDTKNKTHESIILQEKYVTLNDYYHKDEYYNDLSQIKPFTVVKINKLTQGDSNRSQFFNELLKKRNTTHLGNKIQEKLIEIQNKIKQYEDFNALIESKLFNKEQDKDSNK